MNFASLKTSFLRYTKSVSPYKHLTLSHFSTNLHFPPHPHISHWNSLLKSHLQTENSRWTLVLFRHMLQSNVKPNDLTFSLLIKSCTLVLNSLHVKQEVKQIHTHILKCGFDRFVYIGTALLDHYAKSGCVFYVERLFEDIPHRDLIAWNSLVSGYSYNGYHLNAFGVVIEMLRQGFRPCPVTMVSAIPSCAQMELFFQGKSIHGFGIKVGLDLDSRVENALTSMYAKCSDLDAARLLFEGMPEKCVVSWNTMISAYGQNGYFDEAILVFKQMREEDVRANSVTIVSLLSVNAHLESAHSYAVKIGLDSDASVITSLVCMYARSGNTTLAQSLYEWMPCKNLVSITAIISSYAEKGNMDSVLKWFYKIQHEDMKPDAVTIVSILHGFTNLSYLRVGISLHGYSIKCGLTSYSLVINGLISMYDKFDDMDAAASLFLSLDERPLFSWNSMISVYVQRGMLDDATDLFFQMKMFGCSPDTITMTSMLSGCSQLGSLKFGRILHNFILRNSLETEDFMGTALIDMYAKCGSIENAERVFKSIKEPCLATWNAMILGYGMSRLEHKSLSHFSEMMKWGIKPDDITFLGVLSACGHSGLVDDAQKYFKMMEEFGVVPGVQHCTSMVDLLSRAGLLDEALTFIKGMKVEPDSVTWLALLGACYLHQEVKLGESLAKKIFLLDQRNGGLYVLMSNLYASTGRWNDVVRVRKMMREDGEDGCSGTSIIEK